MPRKYTTEAEVVKARKESDRKYREKTREKRSEYHKKYRSTHKEQLSDQQRRWKLQNSDKVRDRNRSYVKTTGKAKHLERQRRYRQKQIALYREFMLDKKCERCPCNDPRVLVWHHKDRTTKTDSVVNLLYSGRSWNTVMLEISKCECLCHNCHATEHYKDRSDWKVRQQYKEFMATQRCNRCSSDTTASLTWHHTDPTTKISCVSEFIAKGNWESAMVEVAKCECLCRNCHHIETNYGQALGVGVEPTRNILTGCGTTIMLP